MCPDIAPSTLLEAGFACGRSGGHGVRPYEVRRMGSRSNAGRPYALFLCCLPGELGLIRYEDDGSAALAQGDDVGSCEEDDVLHDVLAEEGRGAEVAREEIAREEDERRHDADNRHSEQRDTDAHPPAGEEADADGGLHG